MSVALSMRLGKLDEFVLGLGPKHGTAVLVLAREAEGHRELPASLRCLTQFTPRG
jgi:hypothetical protein